MSKKTGLVGGITLAILIMLGVVLCGMCIERVPAGYVAVQYSLNGGVKDEVLTQGWHIVSPMKKTTLYTVGIEQSYLTAISNGDSKDDESFTASSSEGKAVTVELTFTYQYQKDNVNDVFIRFKGQSGKEVRDSFIKPNIISWSKEVIAKYKISDLLGSERANINIAMSDYLSEKFAPYGITISNVSLINIDVDDDTRKVINEKIAAKQNAETQAINNQAEIDKAEAEAEAKVKLTNAQAEADAQKIKAEAEAAANKKLSESLTPELIEKEKIEKWNGKLPEYMGDGDMSIILNKSNSDTSKTKKKK